MNRRLAPVVLTLAIFLSNCSTTSTPEPQKTAQSPSDSARLSEVIPLDPEVRHGVLDNGIEYYIRVNRKPEKRAELRLVIDAGSVLENDQQRGLAHFVEHMAFNGTKNFEKQELVNYLERIGMRFGPDLNAYTSFDATVYMLQIPMDDPKIVETAFDILHDWSAEVSFDEDEVEKERGVVIEEWRLGRSASGRIRDKQFPILFHGSRYAQRLPIGAKEILETAPASELQKFYRQWYRPDLTGVVAVGDFDPDRIESLIKKQFDGMPRVKDAPKRVEFPVPDHEETLVEVTTDREATSISVQVEYKRPPVLNKTVRDQRQFLVDNLYHGMMNGRLRELAQAADPPYQAAFAGSGPLGRTKSSYKLSARVSNGGVERGLATLLHEARRVERFGFAETELSRAKVNVLRNIERAFEERDKQDSARFAAQYVDGFLEGNPAPSIAFVRDLYTELMPGITLTEINARASQWIGDTNRVILVSGPDKMEAAIPQKEQLLAVFKESEQAELTPWVDRVRDEPLVAQRPVPGRIVDESRIEEVGLTRWKLSNGAVVLLKPTDFKNDEVLVRGWSPGGQSLAPAAMHFTATRASDIVAQMGMGKFDRTELGKALTGKVSMIVPFIGELSEGIRGSASPRDLETFFQLLYLRFTGSRRDQAAFDSFRSTLRGQLENQEASPGYWFAVKMNEVLTQDHPRRRFLTVEQVGQIDMEQALTLYNQRFADASDFIFTIVGNFEPAAIRPLIEQWIGGLPATGRVETFRDLGVDEPAGVRKVNVRKGIEPKSSVRIVFHGPARWSLKDLHLMASLSDILRIRLREELREERGGVYGVGVGGGITRYPDEEYALNISFTADPERVNELVTAVLDQIAKLKAEGPADDYLNRVREMQRRQRQVELKQNEFWAYQLEHLASNEIDFGEILSHDERIAAVTRDSMREAARKYLDTSRYVIGVLDPEKKAEPVIEGKPSSKP